MLDVADNDDRDGWVPLWAFRESSRVVHGTASLHTRALPVSDRAATYSLTITMILTSFDHITSPAKFVAKLQRDELDLETHGRTS